MRFRSAPWLRPAFILLLLLPLILALSPVDGAPPAAPAGAVISSGSQVHGGPAPDLVILYAGEVMGWTEPCG